jgi:diguanylate cyclase
VNLFRRRIDPQKRAADLVELRARAELMAQATRGFLFCIKELVPEFDELGAASLKQGIDELLGELNAVVTPPALPEHLGERHDEVLAFARRAKGYLDEREGEFKKIIDLLSGGLAALDRENASFNRGLQQRSQRLEQLSQLDDIRKVRQELHGEVHALRQAVAEKQEIEAKRVEGLKREVKVLKLDVEEAKKEALRDQLTGAANRRAFDRALADLVAGAQMGTRSFSLLLLDVDHFKSFNDRYGHQIGDRVLCGLVETCGQMVRATDMVARFGGEEFAVLMPGSPLKPAVQKARLLCETQAGKKYSIETGEIVQFTVSVGVACYRVGDSVESMVARADAALYQAKKRGRNRAVKEAK